MSFTASPKDAQQCGQIRLNAHLLDELGIRLDPLLLCHYRWVGETVVCVDECPGDRILGPWLVHRSTSTKTIAGLIAERLFPKGCRAQSYASLNRGALLADGKLALKSNAVYSWPSGCCSRHNSRKSGGICERTTFV